MKSTVQQEDDGPITGINVTPLVDVCLVLVIIFMVTTPLFLQPVMKINLPKAATREGDEKQNVTVTISDANRWAVNQAEMPMPEVQAALGAALRKNPDKFVIIRADENARHEWLLAAMQVAQAAGAKSITLATEQRN